MQEPHQPHQPHQPHRDTPSPPTPSTAPYLCVYASQVAACLGENPHRKLGEAVEIMWDRADREGYHRALARNGVLTDDDVLERAMGIPEVSDMLRAAETTADTGTDVASKYSCLSSKFKEFAAVAKLDTESVRVVDDALRKTSYTSYGNEQEHHAFRHIREKLGIDCVEDPTFYKKQAGIVQGVPWYIGGKIDGISSDRKTVIEIKNRVNRLFRRPPMYEFLQVQTYLELLDVDHGLLVECLRTKSDFQDEVTTDVNVMSIERDKAWGTTYFPKLCGFVDFVALLIRDTAMQDKFLRSKRKSTIVAAHVAKFFRGYPYK